MVSLSSVLVTSLIFAFISTFFGGFSVFFFVGLRMVVIVRVSFFVVVLLVFIKLIVIGGSEKSIRRSFRFLSVGTRTMSRALFFRFTGTCWVSLVVVSVLFGAKIRTPIS